MIGDLCRQISADEKGEWKVARKEELPAKNVEKVL
jgi:hypothetical protein